MISKRDLVKGELHRAHCKHVGNAHFDRLLCIAVALRMLGRVGIFLLIAVQTELFSAHPHDANECLYLEIEASKAHHASCKS